MITNELAFHIRVHQLSTKELRRIRAANCLYSETQVVGYDTAYRLLVEYDTAHVTVAKADLKEVLDLLQLTFSFPADSGGGRLLAALEGK